MKNNNSVAGNLSVGTMAWDLLLSFLFYIRTKNRYDVSRFEGLASEDTMVQAPEIQDQRKVGRDELNLAEFPLTLLSDRVPEGLHYLTFKDTIFDDSKGELIERKLTITGSQKWGLPTAQDADVLMALIFHTRETNGFTCHRVPFSLYRILQIQDKPATKGYNEKLYESLRRWASTTMEFNNCWRDRTGQRWTTKCFSLIDEVFMAGVKGKRHANFDAETPDEFCWFTWGETVFESIVAGNIKSLDLNIYFGLKSSISKRLYRFLDKRFYKRGVAQFDMNMLCYEKLGLSRTSYNSAQLKNKLIPAIDELVEIGFLEPMEESRRFTRIDRGVVSVVFARQQVVPDALPVPGEDDLDNLEDEAVEVESDPRALLLMEHGVHESVAKELVRVYPDRIDAQVAQMVNTIECDPDKIKDPAAFLVDAISKNYTVHKPLVSKEDRVQKVAEELEAQRVKQMKRTRTQAEHNKVKAHWDGSKPAQQAQLMEKALLEVPEESRSLLADTSPSNAAIRRMVQGAARDAYIRKLLGLEPIQES